MKPQGKKSVSQSIGSNLVLLNQLVSEEEKKANPQVAAGLKKLQEFASVMCGPAAQETSPSKGAK